MPCSPRRAVLQSPAKAGMPGMRNPGTLLRRLLPPSCPPLLCPVARTGYSPERRHTSCYQEKTLSQRLEWALINRVATGLPRVAAGKAPAHDGVRASGQQWVGAAGATGMARAGGEHRAPSQPCHHPAVPRPLPTLPAEPLRRGASSPTARVRPLLAAVKPRSPAPSPRASHPESCQHVPASSTGSVKTSCLR